MTSFTEALTKGINELSPKEIFDLLSQIEKIGLPETAQMDFWQRIGEDLKIKNSLAEFRYCYKIYALGYMQAARDKTPHE